MAYKEDYLFEDPDESDVKLWRYMDFAKLESILKEKAIFFPSARTLQKIDPWEGTYLKRELEYRLKNEIDNLNIFKKGNVSFNEIQNRIEDWNTEFENLVDASFISCWHYNTTESAAMWRLYLKSNEGISIQTDFDLFKNSFSNFVYNVRIGKVRYKDYENDIFYTDYDKIEVNDYRFNLFLPFIHKRSNYEHEKEYRAIISFQLENNKQPTETEKKRGGIFVPVDLKLLIKKIVLAPGSPEWFKELVEDTLKTYKLDVEVVRSVVDDEPYKFDLEPYKNL